MLVKIFSFFIFCFLVAQASVSSNALYISQDEKRLYSANLDGGSVSVTELKTGKLLSELVLGGELRRIAFNKDESLYFVSDYANNLIHVVDVQKNSLIKSIAVAKKPHGLVFDTNLQMLYVACFEDNKLLAISEKSLELVQSITTEQTPRGLALSDDGRLFVTHALVGKVSIYQSIENAKPLDAKPIKVITLHESQHKNEKVSQGKPVYLDDIEISPDGKEAWLPHMLWNFDHAFQFQSTVFPTISVLDISAYNEKELVIKRKHLFKEINILDNKNKTRIVSNPWDLAFSPNGNRAYITLAGSEDLMVLDIKRSAKRKRKGRQHRIRKKRAGSGAKAVQIYRHLPGKNPQALVLNKDGSKLYVQNAMSLDITELNSGGKGSFARVSIEKKVLAKVVQNDPLDTKMRLGKTLFNLGNTDRYKQSPMTGDFWMSCASCHYEGFNATNRFLIAYAKIDKYDDAVRGHRDLDGYISKNYVADYVRIIKQTQGGFNVGTAQEIDPQNPTEQARKMAVALQTYVRAPENLPHMSTWLKLDDTKKQAHKKEWLNSASCEKCHPSIYKQWANSSHGPAMEHAYYEHHEDVAAEAEGEEFRAFCRGCHMPQLLLTGTKEPYKMQERMFEKDAQFLRDAFKKGESVIEGGTGCFFCHRINKAENAGGNADLQVNLKDRPAYYFEDTAKSSLQWLNQKLINANPTMHKQAYSNKALYQSSLYCATCHNEFVPGTGVKINDNYGEWLASSFNNPKDPSKHKTCIDCHMKADMSKLGEDIAGYSTEGGAFKKNVFTHHFTGANDYFAGLRSNEHRKLSIDLLRTATKLSMKKEQNNLVVRVQNVNAGHRFPGGARREIWLEISVWDKDGTLVFSQGHLNEDKQVPKDARMFKKVLGLKNGKPTGLHFWRYEKMLKDTRIPADGFRDERFSLPKKLAYPIKVQTRLLFRAFSPKLTDKVRKKFPKRDIPYAQVVEVENEIKEFKQ